MSLRLLLISLACITAIRGAASANLSLTPALSVIEVNYPANISCKLDSAELFPAVADGSAIFQWRVPGGFALTNGQSLNGRISAVSENTNQSILVVSKTLLNDTGSIDCLLIKNTTNGVITVLANATVELKTYVLSSYFAEGMIVLSVNCVLFVIFLVCSVRQCCVGRRKEDVYRKYNGNFGNSRSSRANEIDQSNLMERGESG